MVLARWTGDYREEEEEEHGETVHIEIERVDNECVCECEWVYVCVCECDQFLLSVWLSVSITFSPTHWHSVPMSTIWAFLVFEFVYCMVGTDTDVCQSFVLTHSLHVELTIVSDWCCVWQPLCSMSTWVSGWVYVYSYCDLLIRYGHIFNVKYSKNYESTMR